MKVEELIVTPHLKQVYRIDAEVGETQYSINTTISELREIVKELENFPNGVLMYNIKIENGMMHILNK